MIGKNIEEKNHDNQDELSSILEKANQYRNEFRKGNYFKILDFIDLSKEWAVLNTQKTIDKLTFNDIILSLTELFKETSQRSEESGDLKKMAFLCLYVSNNKSRVSDNINGDLDLIRLAFPLALYLNKNNEKIKKIDLKYLFNNIQEIDLKNFQKIFEKKLMDMVIFPKIRKIIKKESY